MEDKLAKFATLVETGSYTKAADALHISQPALSVAIGKLEKSYKTKLVQSAGRKGVELTEAGKAVYATALEHRLVEQELKARLSTLVGDKPTLRLGAIDGVAAWLCAQNELLDSLENSVELSLHIKNSEQLRGAVRRGELDIAVVVANASQTVQLQEAGRALDRLVLVCSSGQAHEMRVRMKRRQQLPFVSYVSTSMTYQTIVTALEKARVAVQPILYSTSPDVMRNMALQGRGAAVLPERLVSDDLVAGSLELLTLPFMPYYIERHLSVVTHRDKKLTNEMSAFIEALTVEFV